MNLHKFVTYLILINKLDYIAVTKQMKLQNK